MIFMGYKAIERCQRATILVSHFSAYMEVLMIQEVLVQSKAPYALAI